VSWWFFPLPFKDRLLVGQHFAKPDFVAFVVEAHKWAQGAADEVKSATPGPHSAPPGTRSAFKSWYHFPFRDISNYIDPVGSVQGSLMGAPT
jgi:hypothetical protein